MERGDIQAITRHKDVVIFDLGETGYELLADLSGAVAERRALKQYQAGRPIREWDVQGANIGLPPPSDVLVRLYGESEDVCEPAALERMAGDSAYMKQLAAQFWRRPPATRRRTARSVAALGEPFRSAFVEAVCHRTRKTALVCSVVFAVAAVCWILAVVADMSLRSRYRRRPEPYPTREEPRGDVALDVDAPGPAAAPVEPRRPGPTAGEACLHFLLLLVVLACIVAVGVCGYFGIRAIARLGPAAEAERIIAR
jgi:hypothetical protein